jgi:beta-lactamase regulating signal transducer with metallopeptidase domain
VHILLNWILQGTIVAVVTAGGLRLLRAAPAATRHAVCWATLAAILSLPFMPFVWAWMLALTPAAGLAASGGSSVTALNGPSAPLMRLPAVFSVTSVLIGAAWMLWTTLQAVRVARDLRWLNRARRRCRTLPEAVAARLSPATARLLTATRAQVVLCDAVRAAAVLGGGQPVIGLHRRLVSALSDSELNAVLVHELAHVVRRDSLASVVQRAVHVVVGWHPGVSWAMRRLALEREMACDEAALGEAGGPKAYATCLTRIAGLARHASPAPDLALGMLPRSGLHRRIVHVLTPGRFSRRTAGWAGVTLCTSLGALALAMGTVVVIGEPAVVVAESVVALETVTARLAQPLQDVLLPSGAQTSTPVAATTGRGTRGNASNRVPPTTRVESPVVALAGAPVARAADAAAVPAGGREAVAADTALGVPVAMPTPSEAPAATPLPQPPARPASPGAAAGSGHERTVTDAAVAAAAGATGAWNATADAAAEAGIAVGHKTQKGAVATAGAFSRWSRRIASSF